ncbi:MAG: peptidase S58, partial [Acidobacteria bacterium]
ILFDLAVGGNPRVRPTADCGYKAADAASPGPVQEGSVGAGAGATVGKLGGMAEHDGYPAGSRKPMKAGIGSASISLPNGLVVAALVAVNAVGDIVDPATGRIVAGVLNADGTLADARKILFSDRVRPSGARAQPKTPPSGSSRRTPSSRKTRPIAWR